MFLPPSLDPRNELRSRYRMRSSAEIQKRVTGDIRKLNARLLDVSNRLAIAAQKHPVATTPPGQIVIALFKKGVNTFRAIQLLKTERLIEESWVLLRVLLEAHINFIYFTKNDGKEMTRRSADAAILDKIKYLKEVKYFEGTALDAMGRRAEWEKREAEIVAQYSANELKNIRRHGFSGLSVQQRAEAVGLINMYQNCYRIASRSVHSFDPAETGLMDSVEADEPGTRADLLATRRETLESTQNMLLGRLSFLMSKFVDDVLITCEVWLLGLGYEKYRNRKDGPSQAESGTDPETFYVWRE